jgi:hypothetical protein
MAARSKQAIAEVARDAQLALRIEDARRTLYSLMECPRGRRALADFDSAARRLIDEVRIQNGTEQLGPSQTIRGEDRRCASLRPSRRRRPRPARRRRSSKTTALHSQRG